MGFIVPSRVNVSSMFGIGQPSRQIEGQSPLTVTLGYGVSLAPLTGLRFLDDAELQQFVDLAACFSAEWCRGGEAVARHLPLRSIDFDNHWVDLCGQGPDRCREGAQPVRGTQGSIWSIYIFSCNPLHFSQRKYSSTLHRLTASLRRGE